MVVLTCPGSSRHSRCRCRDLRKYRRQEVEQQTIGLVELPLELGPVVVVPHRKADLRIVGSSEPLQQLA